MKKMSVLFVIGFMIVVCNSLNAAADEKNALFESIRSGNADEVKILLKRVPVGVTNDYGETPLHVASMRGKAEVASLLLEQGANIDVKNDYGFTPLHIASAGGEIDVISLLLRHGANIEVKNAYGCTPLHEASSWGYKECVELLLNWGANKEAKNNKGETAAEFAKDNGHNDLAAFIELYQDLPEIKEPDQD